MKRPTLVTVPKGFLPFRRIDPFALTATLCNFVNSGAGVRNLNEDRPGTQQYPERRKDPWRAHRKQQGFAVAFMRGLPFGKQR